MQMHNDMKKNLLRIITCLFTLMLIHTVIETDLPAQNNQYQVPIPVYVDANGVMRWTGSRDAVTLFGTNYAPAFAQSYRALLTMGKNHKEAIEEDIYHFARLGLDAYRIHMYEIEITDSLGNLIENGHLDLHEYTIYKMSERGIKTILTPTTYYNAAYPDGNTVEPPGFANYISKEAPPMVPEYRNVVKNYLEQLIHHVNPYSSMAAVEDPNIIALEIDNEPLLGPSRETPYPLDTIKNYINELAGHLRAHGWAKPIFYNISVNIMAKDAVLDSDIDGVTMQWYPAGLTSGKTNLSNIFPFVCDYRSDEVFDPHGNDHRYHHMAKIVYEFDPADIMYGYVMPMMARSFREAGVQFAAQFAYTPMGFAHVNTDFMTHYVNMAYTPSKALGMLIASEVFHNVGRRQQFSNLPADTIFGDFRLSHNLNLAEMNSESCLLFSNNTDAYPRNQQELERIAGTGSSSVVSYSGTGAYFLDKLEDGIWRLEVMPDAISIRDPFERPSFSKYVTHINWREHPMRIKLDNLGEKVIIKGINEDNSLHTTTNNGSFKISPGAYLLIRDGVSASQWDKDSRMGNIKIGEYHAPSTNVIGPAVRHTALEIAEAGKSITISMVAAGINSNDRVSLWMIPMQGRRQRIEMQEVSPYIFEAVIPEVFVSLGKLRYWIVIDHGNNERVTFPGNHPGSPWQWNYYHEEVYESEIIQGGSPIEVFNVIRDYQNTNTGFGSFSGGEYLDEMVASGENKRTFRSVSSTSPSTHRHTLGLGLYIGERLRGISPSTLDSYRGIVIRAKTNFDNPAPLKVILVDRYGNSFSAVVPVDEKPKDHRILLNSFKPDRFMLLPRLYTSGMYCPSWGETGSPRPLKNRYIDEIQFMIDTSTDPGYDGERYGFEIQSAWLE